jgi:hypothetical protein
MTRALLALTLLSGVFTSSAFASNFSSAIDQLTESRSGLANQPSFNQTIMGPIHSLLMTENLDVNPYGGASLNAVEISNLKSACSMDRKNLKISSLKSGPNFGLKVTCSPY